jgi:hypothetical protein
MGSGSLGYTLVSSIYCKAKKIEYRVQERDLLMQKKKKKKQLGLWCTW